jgi:hypothetical protein
MDTEPGRHEARDVSVRAIALAGGGLFAVIALVLVVLTWQFRALDAARTRENPPPSPLAAASAAAPPEPRLQTSPERDLAALRAAEDETLGGYGWVDRPAGVVRIPIDRAMTLVAREAGR